jgi:hypothetical protein
MIYEERIYKIMPGRISDILKRFTDHAVPLFERHGLKLVGFWTTAVGPSSHELTYLLAFDDLNHRERAWAAFVSDPDWIKARAESEKNGPLVADVANRILKPTAFSPLK